MQHIIMREFCDTTRCYCLGCIEIVIRKSFMHISFDTYFDEMHHVVIKNIIISGCSIDNAIRCVFRTIMDKYFPYINTFTEKCENIDDIYEYYENLCSTHKGFIIEHNGSFEFHIVDCAQGFDSDSDSEHGK